MGPEKSLHAALKGRQGRIISDPKLSSIEKQMAIIRGSRDKLWKIGSVSSIKRGNYLTTFRPMDLQDERDPELYDLVALNPRNNRIEGWAKGLGNNIEVKVGGRDVFVCDNHDFAAAYIIEKHRLGVIRSESKFLHLDEHPDFTRTDFKLSEYLSLKGETEKMDYLMRKAQISGWIFGPLMQSSIVDHGWPWVGINRTTLKWSIGDIHLQEMPQDPALPLQTIANMMGSEIVDIDLDVLLPLDERLSAFSKHAIGKMRLIPPRIKNVLKEMAAVASRAKVVTIATSPCYIVQERAMVYLNALLGYMNAA